MIKTITLQHFKCFKNKTTINFSKINVLSGENNTGKYSVLQALMLKSPISPISSEYKCAFSLHETPFIQIEEDLTTNTDINFVSIRGNKCQEYDEGIGFECFNKIQKTVSSAQENSVLIFEYPETGLHPSIQSGLMHFLVRVSNEKNIQLFIKTNSDYMINGLRITVLQNQINKDDVSILYFSRKDTETPIITDIKIDSKGNLSHYPDGFMDEYSKQMSKLV